MHKHGVTWLVLFGMVTVMFLRLPPMAARQDSVLNTYGTLVEVDALARQHFVEPVQDDRLVEGAVRGMLFQLDPYSGYLTPDELAAFERRKAGHYTGVGIELGMRGGLPTVITPVEGSPAAQAGVLAGDVVVAIDGGDVDGLSVLELDERLSGPTGSEVRLTIRHADQTESKEFAIRRGPVSIKTVRGFRRAASGEWDFLIDAERRIGYIRVSRFHENTARTFGAALDELVARGVRGVVVDLRFNPGGLVDQAVEVVDRFLDEGTIVSTINRRRVVREYRADSPGTMAGLPLAVLINGASASAAEIVAGSLQDHERAVIVGERSFGKGSVQLLIYLTTQDSGVMLTVAHYRLPGGKIIHRTTEAESVGAWGVHPDVEVSLSKAEVHAVQESRRALDLVIAGDGESSSPGARGPEAGLTQRREIVRDRQLLTAMSLLGERLAGKRGPGGSVRAEVRRSP